MYSTSDICIIAESPHLNERLHMYYCAGYRYLAGVVGANPSNNPAWFIYSI